MRSTDPVPGGLLERLLGSREAARAALIDLARQEAHNALTLPIPDYGDPCDVPLPGAPPLPIPEVAPAAPARSPAVLPFVPATDRADGNAALLADVIDAVEAQPMLGKALTVALRRAYRGNHA